MNQCQISGHRHLQHVCKDCGIIVCEKNLGNEWNSIHDYLPVEGDMVLIYMRGRISLRLFEDNAFYDAENDYYTPLLMENGVTHWMAVRAPE